MDSRADAGAGLSLELLPFHRLASDKYVSLGLDFRAAGLQPPGKDTLLELVAAAREAGVAARSR